MKYQIDPSDPLATSDDLLRNAIEVLDELRFNVSDQNGNIPIVIDPEWFNASLEYIREVLTAIRERLDEP
jgi:hypothetical protein